MNTLTGKGKLPLPFNHADAHVYHPKFLGTARDKTFLGVELEFELSLPSDIKGDTDYVVADFEEKGSPVRKHINEINKDVGRFAIIKDDGSLDYGIEIASVPATLTKHSTIWDNFFNELKTYKLKSESTCGMHVHVSREGLSDDQIDRIVAFFASSREVRKFMEKIAGRTQNEYCNYIPEWGGDKYSAVNVSPSATIEFRIFKAPKTKEEFISRLQLVRAIILWSRRRKNLNLDSLKKFIKSNKQFSVLQSIIEKRNL